MIFLFLLSPIEHINPQKDTGFAFCRGAINRGHQAYYLPQGGITKNGDRLSFRVHQILMQGKTSAAPFELGGEEYFDEDRIDALFVRTDPPFDAGYLLDTWLLDALAKKIPVINRPSGVREVSEKVWIMQFADITPPTLLTNSLREFEDFLHREKQIVIKPYDGYGGSSVFKLNTQSENIRVTFETLSQAGRKYVIAQKYLPESANGDKRILLLNGEILGAVMRVHSKFDHRNNFFAGGTAHRTTITANDKMIVEKLCPHLLELGLYFVGIDIIGDKLIEVNVTSPTCLQEINALENVRLEDTVIKFVESNLCGKGENARTLLNS